MLRLRPSEIRKLIFVAVVVILLLLFLNIGFFSFVRESNPSLPLNFSLFSGSFFLLITLLVLDLGVFSFSIYKTLENIQIIRLISEIHFIATKNPEHQITWKTNSRLTERLKQDANKMTGNIQNALSVEREIEQAQRELVSNVSHDLRTPLTSILGYLGLIENNTTTLTVADVKQHVHTAYVKAQQMVTMVQDLFDYSQSQSTDMTINWTRMELGQFFDQLILQFELETQEKNITIAQLTSPKNLAIAGDPEKLARVFINLINNALKYGKGATFIKLTGKQIGQQVEIRVANNGEQIPQESLSKLFDRFYRVDKSGNKEVSGTGLGLAIAKGFIDLHHGNLSVESTSELTTFIVTLPLKNEN